MPTKVSQDAEGTHNISVKCLLECEVHMYHTGNMTCLQNPGS